MSMTSPDSSFYKDRHIRYFASALHKLPAPYAPLDTSRLTLVHFATHALDILGVWDDEELQSTHQLSKGRIVNWIYNCLQLPTGGFQGGTFVGPVAGFASSKTCTPDIPEQQLLQNHRAHIAMTYCALLTLIALGDDFSRLRNKELIVEHVRKLQHADGSFASIEDPSEHDMRFLYCACTISYLLQDWSGIDQCLAIQYIRSCRSYDGAFALVPGQEGHGGSTFCAIAALKLMNRLDVLDDDWREDLIRWCVHRQVAGMQGRPNKDEDTCYSYWIGGTLRLLAQDELLDQTTLREYVLSCQSPQSGGFSKVFRSYPDMLHSYYSVAWLSISNSHLDETSRLPLNPINCTLGIRMERAEGLDGPALP